MDAGEHHVDSPEREPGSHRRDGKAQVAMPPGSFREEALSNSRLALFVAVGGLLGVAWGGSTLFSDGPAWQRVLGLIATLAGLLLWVSYFLRFQPAMLAGERWTRSRPRRALRAVLAHAWAAFFAIAVLAWLVSVAFK